MKTIIAWSFGVIGCALACLASGVETRLKGSAGDSGPSDCLSDVTIQHKANPPQTLLGHPSVLRWSVGVPAGCGALYVQFEGQTVPRSGSRAVAPPRRATFTFAVIDSRFGKSAQQTASVSVTPDTLLHWHWQLRASRRTPTQPACFKSRRSSPTSHSE